MVRDRSIKEKQRSQLEGPGAEELSGLQERETARRWILHWILRWNTALATP